MIKKDLQTAKKLVNQLINEIIDRWGSDQSGEFYMIRHCGISEDMIEIQPTYHNVFYVVGDFVHVAEVCGCSFYMDCQENQDGIMTPTLHIY